MIETHDLLQSLRPEAKEIFRLIQTHGPVTKSALQLITNIKLSTLNLIMAPLEEHSLIIPTGTADSTGGRKPTLYEVNPDRFFLIGIDISRTYVRVVSVNLKMQLLDETYFHMDETCTPEETVTRIAAAVGLFTKTHDRFLLGVGTGVVGPLRREDGFILQPTGFPAPGWQNVPLKQLFYEKLGCPVVMENGANTAALGEFRFGAGKDYQNIAYFHCGMGIRTGVISSGRVIHTNNDAEDAFGHMIIDVDGAPCTCGNFGCVECYASMAAIKSRFITELKKGRSTSVDKPFDAIHYDDIARAGEEGDSLSREILTGAATYLGTGLVNFIALFNPELIILSGPVIQASPLFYETCREVIRKKSHVKEADKVVFLSKGAFGEKAIAVGAAVSALEWLCE